MANSFRRKRYNNPLIVYVIVNVIVSILVFYSLAWVVEWMHDAPIEAYALPFCFFLIGWVFLGIAFKKYIDLRKRTFVEVLNSCFKVDTLASVLGIALLFVFPALHYSVFVLIIITIALFIAELVVVSGYYTFHDAEVQDGEGYRKDAPHKEESISREVHPVDLEVQEFMSNYIASHRGNVLLTFLQENAGLFLSSTLLINTVERFNIDKVSKVRYSTIINLHIVNDIREINAFFATVNERLPYGGYFVGCYESLAQRKQRIQSSRSYLWGRLIYFKDFLIRRVMPKLNLTREIYFWITDGKGRALSLAEVYGRAYFSGFEITQEIGIGGLTYFIARKIKPPLKIVEKNYSIVLGLRRVGKDGQMFKVYKMRTMYPYSSYLQGYVYNKNKLGDGGKFQSDFRINTLGKFMRRYWLDELPMLVNLFRGEMKLVGVRPLSKHYFSLYSAQLQEQRTRHKPGLLPPFYADMPNTIEEIQASEKKYLDECEQKGTFITDIRYFFLILTNIIFGKARSS